MIISLALVTIYSFLVKSVLTVLTLPGSSQPLAKVSVDGTKNESGSRLLTDMERAALRHDGAVT